MDIEHTLPLAVGIVEAFVSHTHIAPGEIPKLLIDTHAAVIGIATGSSADSAADAQSSVKLPSPSEIKKSITDEHLISFEDGKRYKTLRRHLTLRGLTPEQYRAKHGLPVDYPMTSAAYSQARSDLAKALGLGQQRRTAKA